MQQNYAHRQLDPDGNTSLSRDMAVSDPRSVREVLRQRFCLDPVSRAAVASRGSDELPTIQNNGDEVTAQQPSKIDLETENVPLPSGTIASLHATFTSPSSDSGLTDLDPEKQSPDALLQASPDNATLSTFVFPDSASRSSLATVPFPTGDIAKLVATPARLTPRSPLTDIDSEGQTPDLTTPPTIVVLGNSPHNVQGPQTENGADGERSDIGSDCTTTFTDLSPALLALVYFRKGQWKP